jgi:hypothetical protein
MNTPNAISADEGIINGRQLRDRSATILLQNDETTEVVLFSVSVQETMSSRHQK